MAQAIVPQQQPQGQQQPQQPALKFPLGSVHVALLSGRGIINENAQLIVLQFTEVPDGMKDSNGKSFEEGTYYVCRDLYLVGTVDGDDDSNKSFKDAMQAKARKHTSARSFHATKDLEPAVSNPAAAQALAAFKGVGGNIIPIIPVKDAKDLIQFDFIERLKSDGKLQCLDDSTDSAIPSPPTLFGGDGVLDWMVDPIIAHSQD